MKDIDEALKLDSIDALRKEIQERQNLKEQMVGSLYPGIVQDEIQRLREKIFSLGRVSSVNEPGNPANDGLLAVCNWIKAQPEYTRVPVTDESSMFYHVAPVMVAKLIMRYFDEHKDEDK